VKALVEVPGVNKRSGSRGGGVNRKGGFLSQDRKPPFLPASLSRFMGASPHLKARQCFGSGYPLISQWSKRNQEGGEKNENRKGEAA
jgi:hypothetical protein